MELPINTRTFDRALDTVERLRLRRVVAVMGDRLALLVRIGGADPPGQELPPRKMKYFELVMSRNWIC